MVLLIAALGGCGDDEDTTSASTSTEAAQQSGDEPNDGTGGEPENADFEPPPLRVSGGGSAQFIVKDGDNSIANFGEEGDESELREAAETVYGLYVDRAEGDWAGACARLAEELLEKLEQLAATSEAKNCPEFLEAFTTHLSDAAWAEIATVDAASLRNDGKQAFLIYRGAGDEVYAMPLLAEDGEWKVTGLSATNLG